MDVMIEDRLLIGKMPIRAIRRLGIYPRTVLHDPNTLADNALVILRSFRNQVCFIGQGTSGNTILTAMALVQGKSGTGYHEYHSFITFPKPEVKSSTFQQPSFRGDVQFVFVDDHLHIGRTINDIGETLDYLTKVTLPKKNLRECVVGVAANEWNKPQPNLHEVQLTNKKTVEEGMSLIRNSFPNCELWLH